MLDSFMSPGLRPFYEAELDLGSGGGDQGQSPEDGEVQPSPAEQIPDEYMGVKLTDFTEDIRPKVYNAIKVKDGKAGESLKTASAFKELASQYNMTPQQLLEAFPSVVNEINQAREQAKDPKSQVAKLVQEHGLEKALQLFGEMGASQTKTAPLSLNQELIADIAAEYVTEEGYDEKVAQQKAERQVKRMERMSDAKVKEEAKVAQGEAKTLREQIIRLTNTELGKQSKVVVTDFINEIKGELGDDFDAKTMGETLTAEVIKLGTRMGQEPDKAMAGMAFAALMDGPIGLLTLAKKGWAKRFTTDAIGHSDSVGRTIPVKETVAATTVFNPHEKNFKQLAAHYEGIYAGKPKT